MARDLALIEADLNALSEGDFDDSNELANGIERLYSLCDELLELNQPASAAPILFHLMERLAEADLGSPGPVVHTLERWPAIYPTHLANSVRNKPTLLTLWMVNRFLNTDPTDESQWLDALVSVERNQRASDSVRTEAAEIINYQAARRGQQTN